MKVALIDPPAIQSKTRGAGFYGQNLREAFNKIAGVELTTANPDLVHFLYFDPYFLTLSPFRSTKTVVTVFDLTPIVLGNLYRPGLRGEIKWQIQKRLLKTADGIITISQSAKKDIERFTKITPDKIFVTHLAAGNNYLNLNLPRENIILYIGDINANKNITKLLQTMALLPKYKLILVGKAFLEPNLPEAKDITAEINELGIYSRVVMTGYVSEQEKILLLNQAKVYVQPSIYEGFCLPVLEALSCGTPVVCGQNSSLPEVAGDAAIYADVTNPEDMAEKIKTVFNFSAKEREAIIDRGQIQAKKFSWQKTAEETVSVYKHILAKK